MFFEKKAEEKATKKKTCPSCGLPVTDPLWRICPRCRAELAPCVGCADCGACKR
jgi:hypothetical protein